MTKKVVINRQEIFLTIDNIRIEREVGIIEEQNKFVAFYKVNKAPNEIDLGEQVKDENGRNIVFSSADEARAYVTEDLKRRIYPPDFLAPLHYRKENLSEIMHKPLIFDIGEINSESIQESISGKITKYELASNEPNLPGQATIQAENGSKKNVTFFEIKGIRMS